jgi:hypothetical protein
MPKLMELDAPGGTVLFQIPAEDHEVSAVSRVGEVIEKTTQSIGEALGVVSGIAQGFHDTIKDAPVDSAQLEFGLQFTVKGRLYVVDAETAGAIKVTLSVVGGAGRG